MNTDYEIFRLSDELILIRWHRSPTRGSGAEEAYLSDLRHILTSALHPVYFLSDLRRGRITDIRIINQLVELSRHPRWAGSAAFSQNPISRIFVGTFLRFSGSSGGNSTNEMQEKAEDALAFLESLKPGSTTGIDWDQLLTIRPGTAELRA